MSVRQPSEINQAFADAYNSGEIANLVALYEPEAVLVPQENVIATGLEEIRASLTEFLGVKGKMHAENVFCLQQGDIALLKGRWELEFKNPVGRTVTLSSSTAEVVRRQPDGNWLYVIDHAVANGVVTR